MWRYPKNTTKQMEKGEEAMSKNLPEWVESGDVANRGDIFWFEAPNHGRLTDHYGWTRFKHPATGLLRCPCGALSDGGGWSKPTVRVHGKHLERGLKTEFDAAINENADGIFTTSNMQSEQAKLAIRILNAQTSYRWRESITAALENDCTVETFENADGTWHYRAAYKGMILQGAAEDVASFTDEASALEWGSERAKKHLVSNVIVKPTPSRGGY